MDSKGTALLGVTFLGGALLTTFGCSDESGPAHAKGVEDTAEGSDLRSHSVAPVGELVNPSVKETNGQHRVRSLLDKKFQASRFGGRIDAAEYREILDDVWRVQGKDLHRVVDERVSEHLLKNPKIAATQLPPLRRFYEDNHGGGMILWSKEAPAPKAILEVPDLSLLYPTPASAAEAELEKLRSLFLFGEQDTFVLDRDFEVRADDGTATGRWVYVFLRRHGGIRVLDEKYFVAVEKESTGRWRTIATASKDAVGEISLSPGEWLIASIDSLVSLAVSDLSEAVANVKAHKHEPVIRMMPDGRFHVVVNVYLGGEDGLNWLYTITPSDGNVFSRLPLVHFSPDSLRVRGGFIPQACVSQPAVGCEGVECPDVLSIPEATLECVSQYVWDKIHEFYAAYNLGQAAKWCVDNFNDTDPMTGTYYARKVCGLSGLCREPLGGTPVPFMDCLWWFRGNCAYGPYSTQTNLGGEYERNPGAIYGFRLQNGLVVNSTFNYPSLAGGDVLFDNPVAGPDFRISLVPSVRQGSEA